VNFSELFIRRPIATCLLMTALAFVGIAAFPFLPVAPLPQVDFPTIQVTTALAGASAETMASAVATPLERQFGQIASVTQMTSTSTLGATTIVIQFDLNRNRRRSGGRAGRHHGRRPKPAAEPHHASGLSQDQSG
jgi:multidrug efflux pump subunit AcrB